MHATRIATRALTTNAVAHSKRSIKEETMFESPKEDKELGLHKLWIAAFVAVAAIIALVGFLVVRKGPRTPNVQASSAMAANAEPVKDLKIERVTMQKDSLGATAVWAVTLTNKSDRFTYSNITYQTEYMGSDNHLILENKGTIATSIAPNAEKTSEIRDTAYPQGVAWYRFKVTGAKARVD